MATKRRRVGKGPATHVVQVGEGNHQPEEASAARTAGSLGFSTRCCSDVLFASDQSESGQADSCDVSVRCQDLKSLGSLTIIDAKPRQQLRLQVVDQTQGSWG